MAQPLIHHLQVDAIAIAAATTTEARVSFIQFSRAKLHGGDATVSANRLKMSHCLYLFYLSLASEASTIYIFDFFVPKIDRSCILLYFLKHHFYGSQNHFVSFEIFTDLYNCFSENCIWSLIHLPTVIHLIQVFKKQLERSVTNLTE